MKMRKFITLFFLFAIVSNCYCDEKPTPAKRFNFSLTGGTAKQLIEALEAASDTSINSLIPQRMAENDVIPSIELREASVQAVLLSLSKLKGKTAGIWVNVEEVWVLMEPEQEVKAIYIGHLLDSFSHETIAKAIHSSWRDDGEALYTQEGGFAPNGVMISRSWGNMFTKLSFNPDAKMLIAKASAPQIKLAVEIVEQLGMASKPLNGKPKGNDLKAEQSGARQLPTAPDLKSESNEKPKSETEGRSP